ncbi:MAG TPA: hypothetical protein VFO40_15390 [Chthoniobacterales bacterium]|jgi:hypothetical protein|nr:hypothetical protein [Chthoniobacterales bacterium]
MIAEASSNEQAHPEPEFVSVVSDCRMWCRNSAAKIWPAVSPILKIADTSAVCCDVGMPSKDSSYKKVFFTEHMPIERMPASRSLAVIIEILEPAKKNRVDVRDAAMIKFASDLVQKRIMNEGWGPTEKRVETILFNQLPPLGDPVRKGDDFIAWIVE